MMKILHRIAQFFTALIFINFLIIWIVPCKNICEPCLYTKEGVQDGFSVKWAVSKHRSEQIGFLEKPPSHVCWEEFSDTEAVFALVTMILIIITVVLYLFLS